MPPPRKARQKPSFEARYLEALKVVRMMHDNVRCSWPNGWSSGFFPWRLVEGLKENHAYTLAPLVLQFQRQGDVIDGLCRVLLYVPCIPTIDWPDFGRQVDESVSVPPALLTLTAMTAAYAACMATEGNRLDDLQAQRNEYKRRVDAFKRGVEDLRAWVNDGANSRHFTMRARAWWQGPNGEALSRMSREAGQNEQTETAVATNSEVLTRMRQEVEEAYERDSEKLDRFIADLGKRLEASIPGAGLRAGQYPDVVYDCYEATLALVKDYQARGAATRARQLFACLGITLSGAAVRQRRARR